MYRLGLLLLVFAMVPVQAGILWQQLPNTSLSGTVDQEFPDFVTYSTYQVHDVTVGAGGWNISSITGYYTDVAHAWPATPDVRISIFAKTGSLPAAGDDPTTGTVYSASLTRDGFSTYVTASGLSINLGPGDYWIGITPSINFGLYGQEFHQMAASVLGDPTAVRDPGGSFGLGDQWMTYAQWGTIPGIDGAILIEGTSGDGAVPEPATWSLLGLGLSTLVYLRRRR
jgi:hypothetical protein